LSVALTWDCNLCLITVVHKKFELAILAQFCILGGSLCFVMAKKKAKQPAKAPSVQPNKFETLYNRKKFNVLGKKTKGDQKARGKARSDGTEKVFMCALPFVFVS